MIQQVHDVGVQYDSVTVVYMFPMCLYVTLKIIHVDVKHVSLSSCVYNSPLIKFTQLVAIFVVLQYMATVCPHRSCRK